MIPSVGLPAHQRLRRGSEITAVVRRGRRARAGGLVVHSLARSDGPALSDLAEPGASRGPRVAFVAPRACGPAVRRNRTRRRVQEALRTLVSDGVVGADDLVVRFVLLSLMLENLLFTILLVQFYG